jgi:hypothetical protein
LKPLKQPAARTCREDRSGLPWYAHADRWDVVVTKREVEGKSTTVYQPKRNDPVFGGSVELRVGAQIALFVSSNEDDGRYVVPLSPDQIRRLHETLSDTEHGGLSASAARQRLRRLGIPRRLTADEERFVRETVRMMLRTWV